MKDINEVFGETEEVTEVELEEVNVVSNGSNKDIASDYVTAREKIVKSIVRSSQVLDVAAVEAITAPSPRAIEAVSSIAKNVTDATESLMKLHEKFRDIEKEESKIGEEVTDEQTVKTTLSSLLKEINNESNLMQ